MRAFLISSTLVFTLGLTGCDDELMDPTQLGRMSAALLNFEDCEPLDESIRATFHYDIELQADHFRYVWRELRRQRAHWGGGFESDTSAGAADAAAPPSNSSSNAYTDTNTQVLGVDEPDIWKTDGEFIYIVRDEEIAVLRAWPPEEAAKIEAIKLPRRAAAELLLTPDHLVILSAFHAGEEFARGYGAFSDAGIATLPSPDEGVDAHLPFEAASHTRVQLFARPEHPDEPHRLIRDRIFEGRYQSARRHGETVRILLDSRLELAYLRLPQLPSPRMDFKPGRRAEKRYHAKLDRWVEEAKAYVDSLSLADLLPHELIVAEDADGEPTRIPVSCDRVYVPEPDQRELDLLSVLTFSLDDPDEVDHLAVFGGSNIVYSSHDRLISSRYGTHYDPATGAIEERSVLHSFLLNERDTAYEASGLLEGWLRNQFSLDVHEGIIRAAISYRDQSAHTEGWWWAPTANKLITLRPEGRKLVRVGETPPLAPNETIFAVRFMGDYGYIVTFRQVDPLFAIDLRDPTKPKVLGELKIPGFSTYMHPLSEDHLLTIGRDVDESTGMDQGLQLQIFDVSDKANPRRIHQRTLRNTYSTAELDHKAFMFDPRSSILLIAAERYDGYSQASSLELFSISIDAGIQPFGSVRHHVPNTPSDRIERGLLIEDFVYSLGTQNLLIHTLEQPPERVGYVGLSVLPKR